MDVLHYAISQAVRHLSCIRRVQGI